MRSAVELSLRPHGFATFFVECPKEAFYPAFQTDMYRHEGAFQLMPDHGNEALLKAIRLVFTTDILDDEQAAFQ